MFRFYEAVHNEHSIIVNTDLSIAELSRLHNIRAIRELTDLDLLESAFRNSEYRWPLFVTIGISPAHLATLLVALPREKIISWAFRHAEAFGKDIHQIIEEIRWIVLPADTQTILALFDRYSLVSLAVFKAKEFCIRYGIQYRRLGVDGILAPIIDEQGLADVPVPPRNRGPDIQGGQGILREVVGGQAVEDHNQRDFEKKYSKTFVKLKKEGIWAFINYWARSKPIILLENGEEVSSDNANVDTTPLANGTYSMEDTVFIVNKDPNRQWRKGLCEDTYRVHNPLHFILSGIYRNTYNRDISVGSYLESKLVFPFTQSVVRSLKMLNGLQKPNPFELVKSQLYSFAVLSGAISDKFWLSPGFKNDDKLLLWYNDLIVAEVSHDNKIRMIVNHLTQEVSDLVKYNRINAEVIHA